MAWENLTIEDEEVTTNDNNTDTDSDTGNSVDGGNSVTDAKNGEELLENPSFTGKILNRLNKFYKEVISPSINNFITWYETNKRKISNASGISFDNDTNLLSWVVIRIASDSLPKDITLPPLPKLPNITSISETIITISIFLPYVSRLYPKKIRMILIVWALLKMFGRGAIYALFDPKDNTITKKAIDSLLFLVEELYPPRGISEILRDTLGPKANLTEDGKAPDGWYITRDAGWDGNRHYYKYTSETGWEQLKNGKLVKVSVHLQPTITNLYTKQRLVPSDPPPNYSNIGGAVNKYHPKPYIKRKGIMRY